MLAVLHFVPDSDDPARIVAELMSALSVWVRGEGDVLIRADAITVLALGPERLRAEWGAGRAVRLTGTPCSTAQQLGLLEAIQRADADGRAVVVMSPAEPGSSTWRWECVDTLLDRC